jgi:hypothetical protein
MIGRVSENEVIQNIPETSIVLEDYDEQLQGQKNILLREILLLFDSNQIIIKIIIIDIMQ